MQQLTIFALLATLLMLHLSIIRGEDPLDVVGGVGGGGGGMGVGGGLGMSGGGGGGRMTSGNPMNTLAMNSTLLNTIMGNGGGIGGGGVDGGLGSSQLGGSVNLGGSMGGGSASGATATQSATGNGGGSERGVGGVSGGNGMMTTHGHALAGLAGLGIIVPGSTGQIGGIGMAGGGSGGGRMHGMSGGGNGGGGGGGGGTIGGGIGLDLGHNQNSYNEPFISEQTVMAVFTSQGQVGGPCRYMPATRRQNHQCRKELGLPETLREARRLATTHCEDQFRYDRWNCSIETRGKRNIFRKLYKETAFVHALTAAAMTHSIARACAEGRMNKCSCGPRKQNRVDQDFQWGGCNDNLKHGKRVTRSFLDLRGGDGDEVTEILRHDSEVGIEAVSTLMKDKCKCHGVSGSCSMKTCWKKMADFNSTSTLLRQKYNQAIRKAPSTRSMRQAPSSRMRKPKQRRKKQQSQYTTLYYLETSPTYCSVTKDRQCLHPANCANLCCGRGYTTRALKRVEKCRCRFNNGRCCQLICDYCQSYEDRYFCK